MDNKHLPAMPFFEHNRNGYGNSVTIEMPNGGTQSFPFQLGLTKYELVFKDILCAGYQATIIQDRRNGILTDGEMDILINETACLTEKYFSHIESLNK